MNSLQSIRADLEEYYDQLADNDSPEARLNFARQLMHLSMIITFEIWGGDSVAESTEPLYDTTLAIMDG